MKILCEEDYTLGDLSKVLRLQNYFMCLSYVTVITLCDIVFSNKTVQ